MIEAALLFPLLLVALVGAVETGRYVNIHQKLARATVTMADLVARSTTMSEADIQDVFFATNTILQPYPTGSSSRVIISSVTKPPGQLPRVTWQRNGGGSMAANSRIGSSGGNAALPAGFTLADNESVVISEIFFSYRPTFVDSNFLAATLYDRSLFRPRLSDNVIVN